MAISAKVRDLSRYTRSAARSPSPAQCKAAGATGMLYCLTASAPRGRHHTALLSR
jgi:hypothetical protein